MESSRAVPRLLSNVQLTRSLLWRGKLILVNLVWRTGCQGLYLTCSGTFFSSSAYICIKREATHTRLFPLPMIFWTAYHVIYRLFSITMSSRSGCTNALLDFINSNLIRGINFLQICEEIAELNYRHFCRRGLVYTCARNENKVTGEPFSEVEFYETMFYSFSSNHQISFIFLRDFSNKRELYQAEMNKVKGLAISCDHNFKVS